MRFANTKKVPRRSWILHTKACRETERMLKTGSISVVSATLLLEGENIRPRVVPRDASKRSESVKVKQLMKRRTIVGELCMVRRRTARGIGRETVCENVSGEQTSQLCCNGAVAVLMEGAQLKYKVIRHAAPHEDLTASSALHTVLWQRCPE